MSEFRWKVRGTQRRYSTGEMLYPYEEEGVIEEEHMGDALNILVNGSTKYDIAYWDNVDTSLPLTITIEPIWEES